MSVLAEKLGRLAELLIRLLMKLPRRVCNVTADGWLVTMSPVISHQQALWSLMMNRFNIKKQQHLHTEQRRNKLGKYHCLQNPKMTGEFGHVVISSATVCLLAEITKLQQVVTNAVVTGLFDMFDINAQ